MARTYAAPRARPTPGTRAYAYGRFPLTISEPWQNHRGVWLRRAIREDGATLAVYSDRDLRLTQEDREHFGADILLEAARRHRIWGPDYEPPELAREAAMIGEKVRNRNLAK